MSIKYSIIITTKNRLEDLKLTLNNIKDVIHDPRSECIVLDDGSDDGTYEYLENNYNEIILLKNPISKGLIFSRNRLMAASKGEFVVSLDDDLNFITSKPLDIIDQYFENHPECAVQSFRIYWSPYLPKKTETKQLAQRVVNYAGGAHVFRKKAWNQIPDYPDWFMFYGEENYASFCLFKCGWEIHYQPAILTHHRIDMLERKLNKEFIKRQKRSLRSGWFLFILFLPTYGMIKSFGISIKAQLLLIFGGDMKTLLSFLLAMFDLIWFMPKLILKRKPLTKKQYAEYKNIKRVPLFWVPQSDI